MLRSAILLLVGSLALISPIAAEETDSNLFDNVVAELQERFVYQRFRVQQLPALADRYRPAAGEAISVREQRVVVHRMLSNVPATHLGLLSTSTYRHLLGELGNQLQPTYGFELVELDGKHFAENVLEGGPAAKAGLKRGDRIVLVDGRLPEKCEQLDWRSDDAFLADPPIRRLNCGESDSILLLVERGWGETRPMRITASLYSAYEAAKSSASIVPASGRRIAYIHFWFIHMSGVSDLLSEKLAGDFAACDALVLDLRGRGGNALAVQGILEVLSGKTSDWNKPVVALVNRHSRSAKEVMAHELQRQEIATVVGERTAGAVIPATFADVGHGTILMYPSFRLGHYTEELEGVGVVPDRVVQEAGPYSAGADPIKAAGILEAVRLAKDRRVSGARQVTN